MKVTVTGATGTLGREVVAELQQRGDQVTVLSRDAARARETLGQDVTALEWADPKSQAPPAEAFAGQDAVVHLLGEPIAQRWSEDTKREIRDSRVLTTRNLVAVLRDLDAGRAARRCWSPSRRWAGTAPAATRRWTSPSPPPTTSWPRSARTGRPRPAPRRSWACAWCCTRTGVVLSEDGGALEKMLPPFKLGRRRTGGRREAVRALGAHRRRGRLPAALPGPGLGRRAR